MKKRLLSILSVLTCAIAGLGVATLNVEKASAQDGVAVETYTEDFTYVNENEWTFTTTASGSYAKVENGKLMLNHVSTGRATLARLNVPYKNYEVSFTLENSVCTAGGVLMNNSAYRLSPWVGLGNGWGINLGAYYSADGVIPEGEPENAIYQSKGILMYNEKNEHKGAAWAHVPVKGGVKIKVENDLCSLYYWNEANQVWMAPTAWPNANSALALGGTGANTISFGFIGASGSYSIDDLCITNLDDATTALISQTEKNFNYQTEEYVEFSLDSSVTADNMYGVYVNYGKLQEDEYTLSDGKLRIDKQTLYNVYAGKETEETMALRVCLKDGTYDVATILCNNMPSYVLSYYAGGDLVKQETYKPGETVVSLPTLPEGKVGWYVDNKKLRVGEYTMFADTRVDALDETATFEITFSWINLRDKESTQTISVEYGYQITGDEVEINTRYGYQFLGWDYNGVVDEEMKISALYRKLEGNGSDFTLDFNEGVNENYVNYIDLIYPGGYATIEDDYWYVKNPMSEGVLFTEQKYTDFELSMDVVHFANSYFEDWVLCLSFANAEHNLATYYRRDYSLSFHTAINAKQEIFGRSVFFANKTLYKNGTFCGFVDQNNYEVRDLAEPYKGKTQMFNGGLSPDGEKVNIKLRVYKGEVSYAYKFASQSEWTEVYVGKFTEDLTGYIGIQFCSDYWSPYSIGVDNLKIENLAEDCHEISYSIDSLAKENDRYVYTIGSTLDSQVDIDLRRQNWIGTNVCVYNASGELVATEERPVIIEEIYEIGMFVTLDTRKLALILDKYREYASNNVLNIDIEIITNKDSMRIPLSLKATEKVEICYFDGEDLLEKSSVAYGASFALKTFENIPKGYVFVGWKDVDGNVYTNELKAIRNETLVAAFELKEYTVRFMNKDGTPFYSTKVKYGEKADMPKITPENVDGYAFVAWKDADRVITGDTEIVAEWKNEGGILGEGGIIDAGCASNTKYASTCAFILAGFTLFVVIRKKEND